MNATDRLRMKLVACFLVLAGLMAASLGGCDRPGEGDVSQSIDLQDRLVDVELEVHDGAAYVVVEHNGELHQLAADEYMAALDQQRQAQRERGWVFVLFNITSWYGVLWVAMGLTGQLLFTGRMVVQWLVSEKQRRSVVPPVFWWLSLIGASMLLAYFLWRKDIVGVLGQGSGWLIYARNIWMIHRPGISAAAAAAPSQKLVNTGEQQAGEV